MSTMGIVVKPKTLVRIFMDIFQIPRLKHSLEAVGVAALGKVDLVCTLLLQHCLLSLRFQVLLTPHPPCASNGILSHEEVEAFRRFMSQLDQHPTTSTFSFAHSSIYVISLNASLSTSPSSWVIDSGASHHITSMSSMFFIVSHVFKG